MPTTRRPRFACPSSFSLSIEQSGQRLRAPIVAPAFGSASQQDDKLAAALREIHAPSGTEMDARLGDTVAYRLDVPEKTLLEAQ